MSLTRRISHLKEIKPDKKWEKTSKYDLLEEIASQNRLMQAYKLSNTQKVDLFVMRVFNRLSPSMSKVLAGFLIVMMFFGVNIAAQASVPGEPLWPVKRSIEEAELSLTFSPVKKTEVHIKHVNERLEEIDKILEEPTKPEVQGNKEKAIKQAVTHLEKDVISVDSSLKIVKEEKKAIEVVELVKKVTDATKEFDTKLQEKKTQVSTTENKELGEVLTNAKNVTKQVKKSAVNVAIEVHEEIQKSVENKTAVNTLNSDNQGSAESATTNHELETSTPPIITKDNVSVDNKEVKPEEAETIAKLVKEMVASELNDLSVEVKDFKQKTDILNTEDIEKIKSETLVENTQDLQDLDDIGVIKKETTEESEVVIEEAKVLLDNGLLKDAFKKVSQEQEKYEKAEATLEKIEKAIEKSAESVQGTTVNSNVSTSSPNLNIKPGAEDAIKASGVDIEESEIEIKEEETIINN